MADAATPISMLASPALSALFIGVVWTLVKVVKYFIDKRTEQEVEINKSPDLSINLSTEFANNVSKNIKAIRKSTDNLLEMHSVFNENHVPKWYVPAEILTLVRQINNQLDNMYIQLKTIKEDLASNIGDVKSGQVISVEKMTDLINSQKLMTERMLDLVSKLDKLHTN